CWDDEPANRPSMSVVVKRLKQIISKSDITTDENSDKIITKKIQDIEPTITTKEVISKRNLSVKDLRILVDET
ncbi:5573_t:CDS:1, partial [Funneliformis caledonium]